MKPTLGGCELTRIQQFLDQQLSDEENALFEDHLESCSECRRQLEAAAAHADVWSGVCESLNSDNFDGESLTDGESGLVVSRDSIVRWLAPSDDDRMMGRIGGYEVVGIIGTSSMAVVFKAFDPALNRYVAIKLLAPWLHTNGAARKRFSREAQAAAAVVHDNVIEIHSVAVANELPYLVMPFVRGPSLQRRLNDQGPLEVAEVLRIGMQAANGLAAAHSQGLVHRDVKPSNILLADGVERVKLTDFGLARAADDASLTRSGIIAGTPQYMSPEQVRGQSVDQRSDLFSLGSVLYAMCAGRPPFRAETSYGVMRQVTDRDPRPIREVNPHIPDWLSQVISKLMAKQPDDRFESANDVAELLEQCLAHVQQPSIVPLPDSLAATSGSKPRWSFFVAAAAMILTGIGLLTFWPWMNPFNSKVAIGPANSSLAAPGRERSSAAAAKPTTAKPTTATAKKDMPKRLHNFEELTTGNYAKVSISPDGKRIAIANGHPTMTMLGGNKVDLKGWEPTLDILDAESGKVLHSLPLLTDDKKEIVADDNPVRYVQADAIKFSPDGELLAAGTNIGQVKIFDTNSGKLLLTLDDKKSRLADEKTPESWSKLNRAIGSVNGLAFSPDGKRLATIGGSFADFSEKFDRISRMGFRATAPGRLKLWDVETGTLIRDLEGHNDHAVTVAFSPDGMHLASAGRWLTEHERFGNGVIIWNAEAGTISHYIRSTADGGVRSIDFTPDSKQLLIGTMRFGDGSQRTGGVSLVEVSSGQVQWLVTVPGWAKPVRLLPGGKKLAVLCGENSIRFLEVANGSTDHEIMKGKLAPDRAWKDMAFASADRKFAVAKVVNKEVSVEVWDTGSMEPSDPPASESRRASDARSSAGLTSFATSANVEMLACSPDGQTIAVLNPDDDNGPAIELYNPDGTLRHSIKPFDAEEQQTLASGGGPQLNVRSIDLSGETNLLAAGSNFSQVKLFDTRSGQLVRTLDDEKTRLAETRNPASWKPLPRALGSVNSLAFSTDGSRLVTCGESFQDFSDSSEPKSDEQSPPTADDGRIKIWEVETGKVEHDLSGHTTVAEAVFSNDGKQLVSVGGWNVGGQSVAGVIIWDLENGKQVRTMQTGVDQGDTLAVALSPDQKWIAVNSLNESDQEVALTVLNARTGVVRWRRSISGLNKSMVFLPNHCILVALTGRAKLNYFDNNGKTLSRIVFANSESGARRNVFVFAKNGEMRVLGGLDENNQGIVQILDSSLNNEPSHKSKEDRDENAGTENSAVETDGDQLDEATLFKLLQGQWKLIQQNIDGKPNKNRFSKYFLKFKDKTVSVEYAYEGEFTTHTGGPSRVTLKAETQPLQMNWISEGRLVQTVFEFSENNDLVIANSGRSDVDRPAQVEFDPAKSSGKPHVVWKLVRVDDFWSLDSPQLSLPVDYPETARSRVDAVLNSEGLQFIKGSAIARSTTLVYRAGTITLNKLIGNLAKCKDFRVHVSFKNAGNTNFLHHYDFSIHQMAGQTKVNIMINTNSKNLDLEKLYLPDVVDSD